MNGRDLAERLGRERPSMKCLFMSGYTANVIAHRPLSSLSSLSSCPPVLPAREHVYAGEDDAARTPKVSRTSRRQDGASQAELPALRTDPKCFSKKATERLPPQECSLGCKSRSSCSLAPAAV